MAFLVSTDPRLDRGRRRGVREGGSVRAIVSVAAPRLPADRELPLPVPTLPPPVLQPFGLPGNGYLLRETANGWGDEQHAGFPAPAPTGR